MWFFKGSFQGFLVYLRGQRALQERHCKPFWSTLARQVEMGKLCSRAGGSITFEVGGGPGRPPLHHFGNTFLKHAFWRPLLADFLGFGLPLGCLRGSFGSTFGWLLASFFWIDFYSIFGQIDNFCSIFLGVEQDTYVLRATAPGGKGSVKPTTRYTEFHDV